MKKMKKMNNITMQMIFCIAVMGTDDESESNDWFDTYKKKLNGNGNFHIMMEQLNNLLEKDVTIIEYMNILFNEKQSEYLDKLVLGENTLDEILENLRKL